MASNKVSGGSIPPWASWLLGGSVLALLLFGLALAMGFWTPFAPREIGPTVVVLDVRNPDEYAAGHVPGAVNIPVGQTFPTEIAALNLELATPIIVYCRSGNRAAEAVRELWALGFTAVQNGRTPEGAMRLLEGN